MLKPPKLGRPHVHSVNVKEGLRRVFWRWSDEARKAAKRDAWGSRRLTTGEPISDTWRGNDAVVCLKMGCKTP